MHSHYSFFFRQTCTLRLIIFTSHSFTCGRPFTHSPISVFTHRLIRLSHRYGLSELYDANADGAAAALATCASALQPDALLVVVDPASLSLRGGKMHSYLVVHAMFLSLTVSNV